MATLNQVAMEAGVSIATVSHVINKTRYVSPDLVEKVEEAIKNTGYDKKIKSKSSKNLLCKNAVIAVIVPHLRESFYSTLIDNISFSLTESQYSLSVHFHNDDPLQEKDVLTRIARNKKVAGILIVPVGKEEKTLNKLIQQQIPIVLLGRKMKFKGIDSVFSNSKDGIYKACLHLLKSGHEEIAFITERDHSLSFEEEISAYAEALKEFHIPFKEELLIIFEQNDVEELEKKIRKVWGKHKPTTFFASNNRITLALMRVIANLGLDIPKDVSVLGYGDEEWCKILNPPLTTLKNNSTEIAIQAVDLLLGKIDNYSKIPQEIIVPMEFSIRKSTQVIGKGPFGEKPISPEELAISNTEAEALKSGNYKVGISFHYGGTAWSRLYENGIRHVLDKYGISIVSITDAHFDPLLQVTQLEGLKMQNPDAIIAIPVDDELTSKKFQSISEKIKLIFLSNVPKGMKREQYASCVSVNERESGQNLAVLLGNYFKEKKSPKIGFIGHGAPFYGTHLRDAVAKGVIQNDFENIEIVDERYFVQIENTYQICKEMMLTHPEIQGLYISWDRPALEAIKALKELKREDVSIFTFDLDYEIATYLANEHIVKGISSQRPYEQGIAAGLATAKALIGQEHYHYIGVQPYTVESVNLLKAWKDITLEPVPQEMERNIRSKFT
ncbi:LacI family DNA-binding transcriptional regulator [Lederbergia sp. NSJ-179]|uniref:LacI family DNA-binding transcriptional regulator n=1 Tax=Lederbergia sp. NSJ-179 TaxID=2931402 RepID=UPI001FD1B13B|nr:LacI family DNA-binding transcriptional regulator [Lederbergia sp. NSJ-179]MCJ7840701.1 LacI family DNA-binding transcriptional regulator [Lederbergia sp. NSJ-179]